MLTNTTDKISGDPVQVFQHKNKPVIRLASPHYTILWGKTSLEDIVAREYAKLDDKKASGWVFLIIRRNVCEGTSVL